MSLLEDLRFCLKPRCPVCRKGRLFKPWLPTVVDTCAECGTKLSAYDVGDGVSVFLIFILGFSIIPAALWVEFAFHPPRWVHAVVWLPVALGIMAVLMPVVKAYIVLLEWRHKNTK